MTGFWFTAPRWPSTLDVAGGAPLIVDLVDVDSDKWRQYAGSFEAADVLGLSAGSPLATRVRASDLQQRRCVCRLLLDREADLVREIDEHAAVHVVPERGRYRLFQPANIAPASGEPAIVFHRRHGVLPQRAGGDLLRRHVLPIDPASVPEAKFLIVGRNPTPPRPRTGPIAGRRSDRLCSRCARLLSRASSPWRRF